MPVHSTMRDSGIRRASSQPSACRQLYNLVDTRGENSGWGSRKFPGTVAAEGLKQSRRRGIGPLDDLGGERRRRSFQGIETLQGTCSIRSRCPQAMTSTTSDRLYYYRPCPGPIGLRNSPGPQGRADGKRTASMPHHRVRSSKSVRRLRSRWNAESARSNGRIRSVGGHACRQRRFQQRRSRNSFWVPRPNRSACDGRHWPIPTVLCIRRDCGQGVRGGLPGPQPIKVP